GADNTQRNLAAVGDQHFIEHAFSMPRLSRDCAYPLTADSAQRCMTAWLWCRGALYHEVHVAGSAFSLSLLESALGCELLLVGVEVGPRPGQTLIAAVMGAAAVGGLPGPEADALAADLALMSAQAQALLAVLVEAAHRARVGEQRHAVLCHR